jgi:hypothetical protein
MPSSTSTVLTALGTAGLASAGLGAAGLGLGAQRAALFDSFFTSSSFGSPSSSSFL